MSILINYRWALLALTVGLSVFGGKYIRPALQANNDLEIWFDKSDPTLKAYYEFQNEFGNDRIIVLGLKEPDGILEPSCLRKIKRLESRLKELEGIEKVSSITNAKDFRKLIKSQNISYQFISWFKEGLNTLDSKKRQEILNSPLLANRLINKKGDVTLMIIHLESFKQVHGRMDEIIPKIKSLSIEELGKDNVHLSGGDMIDFGLNELSRRDFIKFTGLSYLIMFLILALFYGRLEYIIISFLTAFTTIWLTFSIYGFLGYSLNIFTVMTPTLVIVISLMMSMHIFNEFENSNTNEFRDRKEKAIYCLIEIVNPCFYVALTTMIGFLSLMTSTTAVIKEFGWLTSIGCFLSFLMTFVWSSLLLPFIKINRKEKNRSYSLGRWISNFSDFIMKKSNLFKLLSIFILVIAVLGIMNIKIDLDAMGYFPPDYPVAKDHQFMEDNWGDYFPIDIILQTKNGRKLDDRVLIDAMLNFDAQIVENRLARNTFSYVQVMERFAEVRYKEKLSDIYKNPILSKNFSRSFKRLVENESNILVNNNQNKARIIITGSLQSVRSLEGKIAQMHEISDRIFKENASIYVAGYPALFIKIMNTSFDSMKSSLIVALLLVFLVMLLLLRNLRIALIAIAINVFPILVMLGFLGLFNINLDLATCTISAIILGIAIDDTIHILYRYQKEKKAGIPTKEALTRTHFYVGRIVVLTSLVLFAGYSVLLLASLKTVFYFGLLSLSAVIAIMYGDIVLLTLLLKNRK